MNPPREAVVPENSRYLALITAGPLVWMLHFLASYATVSVWCARFSSTAGDPGPVPTLVAVYTIVALTIIALVGWNGRQRHVLDGGAPPHDADTPEDRHRFLGFATMLLAGLSGVATIYSALAVFILRSC
jgi:hypothetical protein